MSYYDSFAGTDAGGFNNSVAEQQVCSQFLVLNFRYIYICLLKLWMLLHVKQPWGQWGVAP